MSDTPDARELRVVGTRPARSDGEDKLRGRAVFGCDFQLPNLLHGKVLRSPHAHARIVSIDASRALQLPGVRAVVTGRDFPDIPHRMVSMGESGFADQRDIADNCMAKDKALYDGHAVAAVAAESPHVAEEALALIEVTYELLTPVMSARAAMADGAPVIHETFLPGSFVVPTEKHLPNATRIVLEDGAVESGLAQADVVIEREFSTATAHQGYIESHVTTVDWGSGGEITVWTSTQGPFEIRDNIADVLQVPVGRIRVVPLEVGGAFGGKDRTYLDPVAALLSRKAGQPVKMAMRRDEVLRATGPTSGTSIRAKIGARADGVITAIDLDLAYEAGAYASSPIFLAMIAATTRYNVANVRIQGFEAIVNKPKTRPYRAPGGPAVNFAVEQLLDELARRLGIDPIELRIRNVARTGDRLVLGFPCPPIDTEAVLDAVRNHEHYRAPRAQPHHGRGLAYAMWFNLGGLSSARIAVNTDGTVQLTTGSPDMSGTRMTLAMQVAEVLGIAVDTITSRCADSDSIAFSAPTIGSRTTYATGIVACKAAAEVLCQMSARAALLWEVDVAQVAVEAGVFRNTGGGGQSLTFKELAGRLLDTGGPISVSEAFSPKGFVPTATAHLVDVAVDPETGKVDILRYTVFQDVGRAVHPDYVEGQLQGAVAQGVGMALNEEYFYDEQGRLRNPTLLDYRMPTALDLPMIDTVILESPNPLHPFGVRGCGEASIIPPAAAIANAIHDAVGVRMDSLPMAPHKVYAAIAARAAASGD
jgi:xanthine dehydrogenase molybdenum-binding subunit